MDSKQEEYLRDIRDLVKEMREEQKKQEQNQANLTQQVQSIQSALSMSKNPFIPTVTAVESGTDQSLTEKSQTSSLSQTSRGDLKSEFVSLCRELETSIQGVIRAELGWMDKKSMEQLSAINERVNAEITKVIDKIETLDNKFCMELQKKIDTLGQKQSEELDTKENDHLKKQSEEIDKKLDTMTKKQSDELDDKEEKMVRKQSEDRENLTTQTKQSTELVNVTIESTEMAENVTSLSQQQRDELARHSDEVGVQTKSQDSDLSCVVTNASNNTPASIVEQQKANMASCIKEILASLKTEILDHLTKTCDEIKREHQTQLNCVTKCQTSVIVEKITEAINDYQKKAVEEINAQSKHICNKLYRFKLEIFQFTGKECQLVRGIQIPILGVGNRKTYVCHFYVDNFKDLIKSGESVHSYPWFVNQCQTTVQGKVWFKLDGDVTVWLNLGRRAREVGLEPRCGRLKVSATVTDLSGTIENYCVGEVTWPYNEDCMLDNRDWGWSIGDVSCQKLLDLGFASKEKNYQRGAILIVYNIEVL